MSIKNRVKQHRIFWIDFLRAFGLTLVVLGHTSELPENIFKVIYTFHMPLFFFLSGFLWSDNIVDKCNFKEYLKKKVNSLLKPYLKISLLCLFVWGVATPPIQESFTIRQYLLDFLKYSIGICYSIGNMNWMPNCSPIWFLTSLFCADLMFYIIRKFKLNIIWIILLICFGYITTIPDHMPLNSGSALIGTVFMWISFELKRRKAFEKRYILIVLIAILLFDTFIFGIPSVNMDENKYNNYPLFIINATCICLFLMMSIKLIFEKTKPTHNVMKIITFIVSNAIFIFGYNYSVNTIISHLSFLYGGVWYINFVLSCVSLLCAARLLTYLDIKKYFV